MKLAPRQARIGETANHSFKRTLKSNVSRHKSTCRTPASVRSVKLQEPLGALQWLIL